MMTLCVFLLALFEFFPPGSSYKVGLLLDSDEPEEAEAMRRLAAFTVSQLNSENTTTTLEITEQFHDSTYLSLKNSFCALLDENVVAVISACDSTLTRIQVNLANQFHIPLIAAVATNPFTDFPSSNDFEIRLSPSDFHQSKAIFDLLKEYKWYQFSILASADDYGINSIVYLQYLASQDDVFYVRDVQHFDIKVDLSSSFDVILFQKELQLIKDSLAKVIVLNCRGKFAKRIFREAKTMGLMDDSYVWITTDGIASKPESIAYQNSSYPTFYTGLLGTQPQYGQGSKQYNDLVDSYIIGGGSSADIRVNSVKVAMGLSVVHVSLKELDEEKWIDEPLVSCESNAHWREGRRLYEKINENLRMNKGKYNLLGVSNPSYDVMNFKVSNFEKVGSWDEIMGLTDPNNKTVHWTERSDVVFLGGGKSSPTGMGNSLTGYHLRIGIVPEPPIAFMKESCKGGDTSSPKCWYGWNPDIINQLQTDLNFTYEYVMPADNKYGGFDNTTRTWNGMIRDILDRKTDLTTVLSINSERSRYIGYTASIFEDQASLILYTTSPKSSTNLFFFLEPFEISVWLSIIGLIMVIAFLTTFFSKFSPFGSYGRKIHAMQVCTCSGCVLRRKIKVERGCRFVETRTHPCLVEEAEEDDDMNELSYFNSTWLIGTGFVLQGTDTLPTAPSGRFLLFVWWLFVMILTAMYTANLTAHLTLDRSTTAIRDLGDLLSQKTYKWGLIQDRNLQIMMSNHEDKKFNRIAEKAVKLKNLDQGIEEVKKGDFVFIDDNSVLTYNFKGDCKTALIKTGKFHNQWAFGTQVNSPYTPIINRMFLQYREKGWFTAKFDEWYTNEDEHISCKTTVGSDKKFGLPVLVGLFLILGVGISLSFMIVVLELFYVAHQDSRQRGESYWRCLRDRIKFKYREVTEEWFAGTANGEKRVLDTKDVRVKTENGHSEGAKSKC
ncbi:hypothetical protein ACHWQZ_G004325 [Mnemiopsis leidyi]